MRIDRKVVSLCDICSTIILCKIIGRKCGFFSPVKMYKNVQKISGELNSFFLLFFVLYCLGFEKFLDKQPSFHWASLSKEGVCRSPLSILL